jgi:hypothetical protein
MVAVLAGVEASGAPEGVRTPLDCGIVLAGFAVTRLWVGRNRAALDLQEWCVCASEHVTVRVIPSRRAARPRSTREGLRVVVAERIDELEELVCSDLRRD